MMEKLRSRKFWLALVGALAPYFFQLLTGETDPETAYQASAAIVGSYLFGQSYVDGQKPAKPAQEVEAND
jgi:hypothetical protein